MQFFKFYVLYPSQLNIVEFVSLVPSILFVENDFLRDFFIKLFRKFQQAVKFTMYFFNYNFT